MAIVLVLVNVGAIVYSVRNKAKPIIAIVGGILCVVKARRIKDKTITILVKEVIITKRLGKIAKPLKMITSLTGVDQSLLLSSVVVALSITVAKSERLGIPLAGTLVVALSPSDPACPGIALISWPKEIPAGAATTKIQKNTLTSLPVIDILNSYLFPALTIPLRHLLNQPIS
jgi:hypothetical protein